MKCELIITSWYSILYLFETKELKVCQSEMELAVGKKGRTPKKKKRKAADEQGAPHGWIEVLTDMLLGFLSQPSQLWRNVAEQVGRH